MADRRAALPSSLLKNSNRLWDRLSSRSSCPGSSGLTDWKVCPTYFFNGLLTLVVVLGVPLLPFFDLPERVQRCHLVRVQATQRLTDLVARVAEQSHLRIIRRSLAR